MSEKLWQPSQQRVRQANLPAFMRAVEKDWGVKVNDYPSLYQWYIDEPERFWSSVWSFGEVIAERQGEVVLRDGGKMPGAQWFPEALELFKDIPELQKP